MHYISTILTLTRQGLPERLRTKFNMPRLIPEEKFFFSPGKFSPEEIRVFLNHEEIPILEYGVGLHDIYPFYH